MHAPDEPRVQRVRHTSGPPEHGEDGHRLGIQRGRLRQQRRSVHLMIPSVGGHDELGRSSCNRARTSSGLASAGTVPKQMPASGMTGSPSFQ